MINKRILTVCVVASTILSGLLLFNAAAQDNGMTEQQINRIRDNCVSVKNTLNQLHASDALLRVNMGQIYESMSTKLMDKFNRRVANNNYSNTDLALNAASYRQTLNNFRTDYMSYENHVSTTLKINCQTKPVDFFNAISVARLKRSQVHTDVLELNKFLDSYQLAVDQFEKDYQLSLEGNQ